VKGFDKGHKKVGGKTKGSQNKVTKDIKEAYRLLIVMNLPNLSKWLVQIAEENPEKAIRIISELSEYVIPKLARTDLTSDDKPIGIQLPLVILKKKNG
jgi:hypothetical protein